MTAIRVFKEIITNLSNFNIELSLKSHPTDNRPSISNDVCINHVYTDNVYTDNVYTNNVKPLEV